MAAIGQQPQYQRMRPAPQMRSRIQLGGLRLQVGNVQMGDHHRGNAIVLTPRRGNLLQHAQRQRQRLLLIRQRHRHLAQARCATGALHGALPQRQGGRCGRKTAGGWGLAWLRCAQVHGKTPWRSLLRWTGCAYSGDQMILILIRLV
ncbi:hypothetical protein D3C71_1719110 [compost metagenome]